MKRLLICLLTLTLLYFCGCKEEEETKPSIDTTFETEMNEICETIAKLDEEMNSILATVLSSYEEFVLNR